jgi:putative hydrolase of the HAD superfamily
MVERRGSVTRYRTIFLDLDDTLYPNTSGVWGAIGDRINLYMSERVGISPGRVAALRDQYFRAYGTTLNGLMLHHNVDPHDYLDFVHQVPIEEMIRPDLDLLQTLRSLPQRRVVFTNASLRHAQRVIRALGVESAVDRVVDIEALEMINKPRPESFLRAMALCGETDAAACVTVDDALRNLLTANSLGMTTVLVGRDDGCEAVDFCIERAAELTRAVPALLEASPTSPGSTS